MIKNTADFLDGIAHTEWCLLVTRAVLKVVESMGHHKKFTNRIVDAIKKELGEEFVVWGEINFNSYNTHIATKNNCPVRRKDSFYAMLGEPWAERMAKELKNKISINEKYLAQLQAEMAVHPQLQKFSDELEAKRQELQQKAMKLVSPYQPFSDGSGQHFTYATQEMFENLLKK